MNSKQGELWCSLRYRVIQVKLHLAVPSLIPQAACKFNFCGQRGLRKESVAFVLPRLAEKRERSGGIAVNRGVISRWGVAKSQG